MKIIRSTKCSNKFMTDSKREQLKLILTEYGRVVNCFIDQFWELESTPEPRDLLKPIVDSVSSWFSFRLRKVAAREAIAMVKSTKELDGSKPTHNSRSMCISASIGELQYAKKSTHFEAWLRLGSIGNRIIFSIPVKFHQHYNRLAIKGKRLNYYIVSLDYTQFVFKIDTGPKKEPSGCIGIDSGINALASTSIGTQYGTDIRQHIDRVYRCKHGSKGQKRARRALKQRIDEVAREVLNDSGATLVVVENLKNITKNTRRRVGKTTRRLLGSWNVRYWLMRVQQRCEDNRVSFRTVAPYKTSQTCPACNHIEQRNRNGELFLCRSCGHTDNADLNAAKNILNRFLVGPYGADCKPLMS